MPGILLGKTLRVSSRVPERSVGAAVDLGFVLA